MAETKQFRNLTEYHNGNSAENNIKLSDVAPFQHENLATNTNKLGKMNMAQTFCEPVAVCNSNSPSDGAYTATCVNYPDFAVSYDDSHGTSHYLYGMKVRVIFTYGITYGSVSSGTYPTLSINGSGALPLLAQGKTMAQGAVVAGQSVEFTIIPYGNSIAFDADSNVRENTNDYTIYTDGDIKYPSIPDYSQKQLLYNGIAEWQESFVASKSGLLTCTGWGGMQSNSYIEYRINGIIFEHQGNSNEAISCTSPIKKGDTVLIHVFLANNNYGVYFVPFI